MITIAAAGAAILLLAEMANDHEAYYGDGGQARYPQFLLYKCRPKLFFEITRLEQTTFYNLVKEIERFGLLKNGSSVSVEEQLLIFLDIFCNNNSMCQTAVKFCRGLYKITRFVASQSSLSSKYCNSDFHLFAMPKGTFLKSSMPWWLYIQTMFHTRRQPVHYPTR
jgi:hypothetical protein